MRIFITRSLAFFIPVIICIFIIEYSLRAIPNDYSYKNSYLKKHAYEIEVLILGNSHTYRGIIPKNLNFNSFNASYISQSLNLDFLIFNKYKNQLNSLKYLILNISYPSLFSSLETSKENWRLKNYNLYYNFNITIKPKNYFELLSNTYSVNKERFFQYYINDKNQITCSNLGEGTIEENKNIDISALKAVKRHTKEGLPYYKEYLSGLNDIILYARVHDIKIILVTLPAYKEYANNLDKKQLKLMNTLLDSIVYSHNNVYRKDYLYDTNFIKEDFLNADHLNKKGAEKLTFKLNNYIESLSN